MHGAPLRGGVAAFLEAIQQTGERFDERSHRIGGLCPIRRRGQGSHLHGCFWRQFGRYGERGVFEPAPAVVRQINGDHGVPCTQVLAHPPGTAPELVTAGGEPVNHEHQRLLRGVLGRVDGVFKVGDRVGHNPYFRILWGSP